MAVIKLFKLNKNDKYGSLFFVPNWCCRPLLLQPRPINTLPDSITRIKFSILTSLLHLIRDGIHFSSFPAIIYI